MTQPVITKEMVEAAESAMFNATTDYAKAALAAAYPLIRNAVLEEAAAVCDAKAEEMCDCYDAAKAMTHTPDIEELIAQWDWQPIETAPKDGTVCLVYMRRNETNYEAIFIAKYDFSYSCREQVWKEVYGCSYNIRPQKWKPIDSPLADTLRIAVDALEFYARIGADGTADFALRDIKSKLKDRE